MSVLEFKPKPEPRIPDEILSMLVNLIKQGLERSGITAEQLCQQLSIEPGLLADLDNGRIDPLIYMDDMCSIMEALGYEILIRQKWSDEAIELSKLPEEEIMVRLSRRTNAIE